MTQKQQMIKGLLLGFNGSFTGLGLVALIKGMESDAIFCALVAASLAAIAQYIGRAR